VNFPSTNTRLGKLIECRAGSTKAFQNSPIFQEAIAVEEEIGKLRSVGLNYANYIPSLRFLQSISKLFGGSPTQNAANIGKRRADYNRVFLDELKKRVVEDTDSPCIQGGVLRDPESSNLTETELLGISFSMMAVSFSLCLFGDLLMLVYRDQRPILQPLVGLCYSSHKDLISRRLPLKLSLKPVH